MAGVAQIADLDQKIVDAKQELKKARRKARWRAAWIGIFFFVVFFFIGAAASAPPNNQLTAEAAKVGFVVGAVGALISALIAYFVGDNANERYDMRLLLERLAATRRVAEAFAPAPSVNSLELSASQPTEGAGSYFDKLVRINVENLAAYYSLVRIQTDKSFVVSIAMGIAGFLLICFGLVSRQNTATVAAGSGVITEFIAAVFFYLYNRTVRQMKDYHDTLISVQNVLLAFKMLDEIDNDSEKARMIGLMLSHLLNHSKQPSSVLPESAALPSNQNPDISASH